MPICDHFIYTTALIGNKSGYQIVAKSSGISQKLIDDMEGYFFPSGIDPVNVTECSSMLVFTDYAVFSRVKNIGIGFDGRNNTLYNHSIVIKQDEFLKIKYDSRVFLEHYFEDPSIHGILEKIFVEEKSLPPTLNLINKWPKNMLETIFDAIFSGKKIAILGIMDNYFIQNLLSLLPTSLRKVSFSSLVLNPQRQPSYDFIQLTSESNIVKNEIYQLIDISKLEPIYTNDKDPIFERAIKFYVDLIKNQKLDSLNNVNTSFDEIQNSTFINKLELVTYFNKIHEISDESLKHKLALDIFDMLVNFDLDTIGKYLPEIEKYVPAEISKKYSIDLEIAHIVQKSKNEPINLQNLIGLFHKLSESTSETRMKLLNQLAKTRLNDFLKNGSTLLFDSRLSYYENDILQIFIELKQLHTCIFELFDEKNDLSSFYKQSIFEVIIDRSLKLNPFLIIQLLHLPVFNFKETYETRHYRKILENVLENPEFIGTNYVDSISKLANSVYNRIVEISEYTSKSGTSGTAESNLRQFVKILQLFHDYFIKQLDHHSCTKEQTATIQKQNEDLKKYLEKYSSYLEPKQRRWWFSRYDD